MEGHEIKKAVREGYGKIAVTAGSCCFPSASCCGGGQSVEKLSRNIGYRPEDLQAVPEGANLGLGCGNPLAHASLKAGEVVVDLGSGAGFDCFLAANAVGPSGQVIGVDMTPEMLDKARENARKGGYGQVEFRLGEIENLPVADNTADIVISNCVINLAPDKERVFREAFRILRPSGRLMVSDLILLAELPEALKASISAYIGCIAGAVGKNDYLQAIQRAGFQDVRILEETTYPLKDLLRHPVAREAASAGMAIEDSVATLSAAVASIKVVGWKG